MNAKLRQFERESKLEIFGLGARREIWERALEQYAELIIKECATTLEFHGYDDAVPYVKWMATNKLGLKE